MSSSYQEQVNDAATQVEDMFQRADILLFKDRDSHAAEKLYRQILDADVTNIDALNSIAYCVRMRVADDPQRLFEEVYPLYIQALKIDKQDVEANFNLALLYLQQKQDLQ